MNTEALDTPTVISEKGQLIYRIESHLNAPVSLVWKKLTNKEELLRWDSMLMELEGTISEQGKIKL